MRRFWFRSISPVLDDAVKIAAGERQLLGALLVQSGRITGKQLDHAIAEQKRSGEKLGVVFTRLGMLTERQLSALLEFQHNQEDSTIPVRSDLANSFLRPAIFLALSWRMHFVNRAFPTKR